MSLNRINNRFFNYIDKNTGYIFNFKAGEIGVNSAGRCWRLSLIANGCESVVACFVTQDDSRKCYLNCVGGKIWEERDALMAADLMIDRILNPIAKTVPVAAANDAIVTAIRRIAELSDINITNVLENEDNDKYMELVSGIRFHITDYLISLGGKFNF